MASAFPSEFMGASFQCTNCEARYLFDAALTGRALTCGQCGTVFRMPSVPLSAAPPAGLESSSVRWYLHLPSGRQFGPVLTESIAEWLREGRADGESLVCQEGSEEWLRIADAFPELLPESEPEAARDAWHPTASLAAALPATGLLDYLQDSREKLSLAARSQHDEAREALSQELRRGMGSVRLLGVRSIILSESDAGKSRRQRDADQMKADHLLIAELTAHGSSYYLLIPWGPMGRMAHEFFSILPGRMPHSLALRRGCEAAFGTGQWIGINGAEDDVVAMAARRSRDDLISGIVWDWFSARRDFTMVQVWGVQAIPLGPEKFLHAIQTSPRGPSGNEFGLLWYLERQSAYYRFARRLNIPDTHESHILFGSCTGRILTMAAEALYAASGE